MKPVFQTLVGPVDGNCLAACIASLLEIGIDDVPDLSPHPEDAMGWTLKFREYMKSHGVYPVIYSPGYFQPPAGVYYLIWGTSPRNLPHSVIGRNGKIVHDPNPAGGGVDPITEIVVFFPTFERLPERNLTP